MRTAMTLFKFTVLMFTLPLGMMYFGYTHGIEGEWSFLGERPWLARGDRVSGPGQDRRLPRPSAPSVFISLNPPIWAL